MSKGAHGRKQWDLEEQGLVLPPDCEIIPKREILPQHEEYLINLQQKNRVIRKLKAKARDPQQLELERKEQGFSLYVNGAHSEHSKKRSPPSASRSAKTAGDDGRSSSEFDAVDRATTAPAKPVRRNWLANSINLKTSRGDQLKIRAPNAYIGSYADDFEDVEVSESFTRDSSSHEDSCDEDDEAQMTRNMEQLLGRHRKEAENETDLVIESRKVNELKRCTRTVQSCLLSDDDTEDSGKKSGRDQLLLSIADVKTLRASLQLNSSIQQSIINGESETSSGEEEVEEEEEMGCGSTGCGSMGCGTGSAEEIEEELGVEQDSLEEVPQCRKTRSNLRADDVIVLEFARPQRKEHHLLAARKTEARHTMTSSQDQRQTASSRLSTDKTRMSVSRLPPKSGGCRKPGKEVAHKTGGSQVRSSRPLSVGHRGHPSDAVTAGKQATGVMGGVGQGSERTKRRTTHSAPGRSQHSEPSLPEAEDEDRPLSASVARQQAGSKHARSSRDLSGRKKSSAPVDMDTIINKVLQLNSRDQRRLMKALTRIEAGATMSSESSPNTTLEDATSHRKQPLKAMAPVSHMVKSNVKSQELTACLVVRSNWGDPRRVGLTEIQFIDHNKRKIAVILSAVSIGGGSKTTDDRSPLFNGKCKTMKERNMWTCDFSRKLPIELSMVLEATEFAAVSHVKMWNYNKSLSELSIGARQVQLWLGKELVFDGELDKGCGNQVFDYEQTIVITPDNHLLKPVVSGASPEKQHRSSTSVCRTPAMDNVALFPSTDLDCLSGVDHVESEAPSVRCFQAEINGKKQAGTENGHRRGGRSERMRGSGSEQSMHRHRRSKVKKSKMAARLGGNNSSSASKSHFDHKSTQDNANTKAYCEEEQRLIKEDPSSQDKQLVHAADNPNSEPTATVGVDERSHEDNGTVDDTDASPMSPHHMSDEDNTSMLQQIRNITTKKTKTKGLPSWLNTGQPSEPVESTEEIQPVVSTSHNALLLDNWPCIGSDHLPTVLDEESMKDQPMPRHRNKSTKPPPPIRADSDDEETRYRQLASSGGLDDVDDDQRHMTPMRQIETARAQWRKHEQSNLEESWTSLNMFDRSQRGRISLDLEKDILDEYLAPERIAVPHEETIAEEEECSSTIVLERDEFVIPELPRGQHLVINILTTWGDRYYVGLNGIEIFSNTGELVTVTKITADPADINVLPEYTKDPRVVANLIDGVNRTRDDTHLWLAPFTKCGRHSIELMFHEPVHIAMMRIWNYNKSRIHSYRGVRDIEMTLDGFTIFKGEITRACGDIVGGSEDFGETILFTMDEDTLEAVSLHDQAFRADFRLDEEDDDVTGDTCERPQTADDDRQGRPYTTASKTRLDIGSDELADDTDDIDSRLCPPLMQPVQDGSGLVMRGQCLKLNFTATWGDPHYLGLTGLEIVGKDGEALPVSLSMLDADPRDLHTLPGYETDDRTLDKLIDGTNVTMSDEHMWLVPLTEGEDHWLCVTFHQATDMTGLRIWNYNKSAEDTYRGARIVHVTLDDRQVSPPDGFLVRKGSGNCYFDFAQEISFTMHAQFQSTAMPATPSGCLRQPLSPSAISHASSSIKASQEYEAVQMPRGFIYQFHLLSTWGDPYYVGLCSLDFYDSEGLHIDLTETNIAAYPDSVNVLEGVENDVRTPDKLIDGVSDTTDGCHMWLAPILPGIINRVYVIFDQPIEVSMIKICDYSKTPTRGVKDFALLVDDLLVYNGTLEMSSRATRGILPTCPLPQPYHTILFTDNKAIQQRERHTVIRNQAGEQDVQLMNDRQVVAHYTDPKKAHGGKPVDQAKRPTTSVTTRGKR